MRKLSLLTSAFLVLSFGLAACTDDGAGDDEATDTMDTNADDTTTGDGDTSDTTDDGEMCVDAPPECLRFVRCLNAISEGAGDAIEGQYGADGSCWCGTTAEINSCYDECVTELAKAVESYPTVNQCHENYCTLDELDPSEPYGPIEGGACPDWSGNPQEPIMNPLGVPGGFCSPPCGGVANSCPEHSQTSADGTCFLILGDTNYCISRCYVDPTVLGGTQCQCGATCQPQGAPDGEGNMRGICTFE